MKHKKDDFRNISELNRIGGMSDSEFENYKKYSGKLNYVSKNEDINRFSLAYQAYDMDERIESKIISQMDNDPEKIKTFIKRKSI